jgi:Fe2+ or Zn2+ uptake regulation protein
VGVGIAASPPGNQGDQRVSYAEQLRAELVEVLAAASGPTTTRAARIAIAAQRGQSGRLVVAEDVYRALQILRRRGVVRRVDNQPGRHAHWELIRNRRRVDPR